MKTLKCSLAAKTVAIILMVLLIWVGVACSVAAVCLIDLGAYSSRGEALYTLQKSCGRSDAYWLASELDRGAEADDLSGELELRLAESPMRYRVMRGETILYDALPAEFEQLPESSRFDYTVWAAGVEDIYYDVLAVLEPAAELTGNFKIVAQLFELCYSLRYVVYAFILVAMIACVLLMVFLMASAGHRAGTDELGGALCRFPFDVETAVVAIGILLGSIFVMNIFDSAGILDGIAWLLGALALATMTVAAVLYLMSLAVRIKRGTLFRELLIVRAARLLWRGICAVGRAISTFFRAIPLVWRAALGAAVLSLWLLLISVAGGAGVLLMLGTVAPLAVGIILGAVMLRRLCCATRDLADGNIDASRPPVDTSGMVGELRELGENINRVSEGMSRAVEARMRSERFKTELITNVSHDLKTPLTSIINYSELIAREPTENDRLRGYAVELTRQSERLKGLIVDLVEASKAATGNVELDMQPCNISVLLAQAAGEYQGRLEENGLTLVSSISEENVYITADAPRLWRVLDNLMGNALKYSQPGTRVYLTLRRDGRRVQIGLKNTSREQLNIPAEELLERFVRGDSSRHTDGSGLGLSIARSLIELMGGELRLEIDGDLFKVWLEMEASAEG